MAVEQDRFLTFATPMGGCGVGSLMPYYIVQRGRIVEQGIGRIVEQPDNGNQGDTASMSG